MQMDEVQKVCYGRRMMSEHPPRPDGEVAVGNGQRVVGSGQRAAGLVPSRSRLRLAGRENGSDAFPAKSGSQPPPAPITGSRSCLLSS